jgi:hypothetical protein
MKFIDKSKVPHFANVTEFAKWYLGAGMPVLFPERPEVFVTDDATATCLFRHGRFQFEIYLIHPNPVIPQHEHPGVSNLELAQDSLHHIAAGTLSSLVQQAGQSHGVGFHERASHNGFALMSAQMWDEGLEISTIGARWKGNTAGPKHEALIRRFNPDCLVYPGFADVTQKAAVADIL